MIELRENKTLVLRNDITREELVGALEWGVMLGKATIMNGGS